MLFRLCIAKFQVITIHVLDTVDLHFYHNFPAGGSNMSCSNVSLVHNFLTDGLGRRHLELDILPKGL